MNLIKLLLTSTLASLVLGQIIRLPLFFSPGAFTITDMFVAITDFVFLVYAFSIKRSLKFPPKTFLPFFLFISAALASTTLASNKFTFSQILTSSLFLARFIGYFLLSQVAYNTIKKSEIKNWVKLILACGFLFVVLGLIQFVLLPDLSFLTALGWDPHQKRIASTILDPNFSGLIYLMIFVFSASLYLFQESKNHHINRTSLIYLLLATFSFIALILTFSRSSYLAFFVSVLIIGLIKSQRLLIITTLVFLVAFASIGQIRERIIGAVTLDETARARLESYTKATTIFRDNLAFGVGFNTYRFAQAKYGFFPIDEPLGGHSGAGADSSLLLVAATTGLLGLILFCYFLFTILVTFKNRVKTSYLHLASLSFFSGLITHSQFVNSLFFPQIAIFLWIILGLVQIDDS